MSEILQEQSKYIALTSSIISAKARNNNTPIAMVRTYGCQQNVADSEKIKGILEKMGCEFTDEPDKADIIIYNTCAVREHAEDRVFGNVGALKNIKRKNPNLFIALCGCMMEQQHIADKIYKSFPFVNLVFGTHSIHKLPYLMYLSLNFKTRIVKIGDDDKLIHEGLPIKRDGTFKGWLPIMYGCDNFCTYCIVPYVRGRERSREPQIIFDEAKEMIQNGYKDITLLGQNVNSYGKNLNQDINFAKLLDTIANYEGDFWIRFMTSHPKDATKELIDTIAKNEKICNHIHLPFQSGSNRVLKAMNRNYTREKYLELVNYIREKIPDVSLTSDVIVGFPGETYEEFEETLSLIREVKFTSLFTFIYSPRVGTPAAKMDDPITYEEKARWMGELLKVQEEIAADRCASMVGKTYKVLVESEANTEGELSARNQENIVVEFEGDKNLIGQFVNVEITRARNWILKGKLLINE